MRDYYSADQQIHRLSQLLAKINRTYLAKQSDDSHTNLYFDSVNKRILGRWLESSEGNCILGLNLNDLSFELHDQSFISIWLVNSQGKSIMEVEGQLDSGLNDVGFTDGSWKDQMHYEIPDYGLNKSPIESLTEDQISVWSQYRALANYACTDLLGNYQARSETRIWPHHFDTGIYFELGPDLGIGFGLAMKDMLAEDAYFYLSAYAEEVDFDYSRFRSDSDWEWKWGDWEGAMLKLTYLEGLNQKQALKKINSFSSLALEQVCATLA